MSTRSHDSHMILCYFRRQLGEPLMTFQLHSSFIEVASKPGMYRIIDF